MSQTLITHDLTQTLEGIDIEIYALLRQGLSNAEISEKINMPFATVKWHLRNIYKHLGVEARGLGDCQTARQRAMMYGGTRLEQVVTYAASEERGYLVREIRDAAKKTGLSKKQVEDLISFLEMEQG